MTAASEPLFDMHSNTQRQLEAYQFASQPDFIIAKDNVRHTITVSGRVTDRMAHDAVSTQNGVENQFHGYFAPHEVTVSVTPTRPDKPDAFHATLTGSAYSDFIAGEAAQMEQESSGRKPEFLRHALLRAAYGRINKPDFTLSELPGLNGGTITINGPINHRIRDGMKAYFAEHFGSEGLEVEYSPRIDPQHFTAHFTGAAYAKLKAAQAAHEALEPAAIGH